MSKRSGTPSRSAQDRAIEEIYRRIPDIPGCTGACATACGPIAMFRREWERIKQSKGHTPRARGLMCPMLSPTGWCTVYTVRPYICRLWGTTPALKCPEGCEPTRWLTTEEAREIFMELRAVAGPEVDGPLGDVNDLWGGIALEARSQRNALTERIAKAVMNSGDT